METIKIHDENLSPEAAEALASLCPFGAISYQEGRVRIDAGCRMCRVCVKKGPPGVFTLQAEEAPALDKSLWQGVAVYAEQSGGKLHNVTRELIGKARELAAVVGHPVYAVAIGRGMDGCASELARCGADKVYIYDDEAFEPFRMEPFANAFSDFIERARPCAVLVGATTIGRSLAPRVAARFRTGLTADCTALEMKQNTDIVQIRPAFGGNIMARIVTPNHRPQFSTVRYKVFDQPAPVENPSATVERVSLPPDRLVSPVTVVSVEEKPRAFDLSEAKVVVAVGRGLRSKADLALAEAFAGRLGAQLACTRPLVENGWFDPRRQIGLSGRTVNADLIVTLGISGSVQFAAGMRGSRRIVAVNSDPNAPIFDIAHHGLVGDLYEILPELLYNRLLA